MNAIRINSHSPIANIDSSFQAPGVEPPVGDYRPGGEEMDCVRICRGQCADLPSWGCVSPNPSPPQSTSPVELIEVGAAATL